MRDEWNYEFRREEEETDLILARYLAYSGKREYELNGKDRFILKIAYLTKGRNHKIKGRYEDTEEYRQTMTVIAWAPNGEPGKVLSDTELLYVLTNDRIPSIEKSQYFSERSGNDRPIAAKSAAKNRTEEKHFKKDIQNHLRTLPIRNP